MIGCDCRTCRSPDPRDRRRRPSIYVQTDGGTAVLVDAGPDLREQALAYRIRRLDAIVFTHGHADHILGMDDVRRFNILQGQPLACYGDARTIAEIRQTFAYAFERPAEQGGWLPQIVTFAIQGPFCVGRQEVVPIPIFHGGRPILGFRFGAFAYLTDCSRIPDSSLALLENLEVLVIDALRDKPHPTHFTVEEAIEASRRIAARRTYFTHMNHDLPHAATSARLPDGVELAYDGLVVECS